VVGRFAVKGGERWQFGKGRRGVESAWAWGWGDHLGDVGFGVLSVAEGGGVGDEGEESNVLQRRVCHKTNVCGRTSSLRLSKMENLGTEAEHLKATGSTCKGKHGGIKSSRGKFLY